jgi:hypothetical protein
MPRIGWMGMGAWLLACSAWAQLYNPQVMLFDSPDHAMVTVYKVEVWSASGGQVLSLHDLSPAKVHPSNLPAPQPQWTANLNDLVPQMAAPAGQSYVIRVVPVAGEAGPRSEPSTPFRWSPCAALSASSAQNMTVTWTPPMTVALGQTAMIPITLTGPSPIHSVVISTVGDGQPEWYYTLWDARTPTTYAVGPFKKRGRFELTARAIDELGCEVGNGIRSFVVVQ